MISGQIAEFGLAWLPIRIQDGNGGWQTLRVVADTGFTGQLALPESVVRRFALNLNNETRVTPAAGPPVLTLAGSVLGVLIDWMERIMPARVVQAGAHPLLGMSLLWHHHIAIDAVANGPVTLAPLPI